MLIQNSKKELNQTKSSNLPQWYICCPISSFKKGGKIQTGLNCGYDGLSEVILSLSHSSARNFTENQMQPTEDMNYIFSPHCT